MLKHFFFFFSLIFIITSCSKDESTSPTPITLWGTWTSGEMLYHPDLDCEETGVTFEDYIAGVINSIIETSAAEQADIMCITENDDNVEGFCELPPSEDECELETNYDCYYEEALAFYLGTWTEQDQQEVEQNYAVTTNSNDITLYIYETGTYEMIYDGQCENSESQSYNWCTYFDGAEWNEELDECELLSEISCEEGGGYWDDGPTGEWEASGNHYVLIPSNDSSIHTYEDEILYFDGTSIYIISYSEEEWCACNSETSLTNSDECESDGCEWINDDLCVSLNF